ncbi:MAG TPA: response regulator, partial [Burkholderiales bacterium]|nr:response regulator [Burkholderiales bacterium]
IRLTACRRGTQAVLTVTDTGLGIPPDKLESIFEMFTQLHGSRGAGGDHGLGIGLHIVRKLVEMHGGKVVARSEGEKRGSEFVIELPLMTYKPAVEAIKPMAPKPGVALRVLVVDDNRDAAESLAALLDVLGHTVRTAFSGEDALTAIAARCPDVVLLDIGMPGMDGHEVARRIRAMSLAVQPYIVAVTGWGQPADKDKTAAAGIDRHLVKPIATTELHRALEMASAVLGTRTRSEEPRFRPV